MEAAKTKNKTAVKRVEKIILEIFFSIRGNLTQI